jgi:hypothetical protein
LTVRAISVGTGSVTVDTESTAGDPSTCDTSASIGGCGLDLSSPQKSVKYKAITSIAGDGSRRCGFASGPIVGGILINKANWRWIFIDHPGRRCRVAARRGAGVIRESRDKAEVRRFDGPGIVLLSGMLCTIVWGVIDAEKHGWGLVTPFAWLIGPPGLMAAFVAWQVAEGRIRYPHIPLRLFPLLAILIRRRDGAGHLRVASTARRAAGRVLISATQRPSTNRREIREGRRRRGVTGLAAGVRGTRGTSPSMIDTGQGCRVRSSTKETSARDGCSALIRLFGT